MYPIYSGTVLEIYTYIAQGILRGRLYRVPVLRSEGSEVLASRQIFVGEDLISIFPSIRRSACSNSLPLLPTARSGSVGIRCVRELASQ